MRFLKQNVLFRLLNSYIVDSPQPAKNKIKNTLFAYIADVSRPKIKF